MGPFLPIQSAVRIVWNATHAIAKAIALPNFLDSYAVGAIRFSVT